METGKAIYNLLKDSADVGAICADRIYPELAQQDVDVPFIVYTVTDTTPSDTKNSTSKLDTARVELYCVSDDYEQSMNLGIAVRGALDRHTGTVSGVEVQSIDFDTSDVQFDPDQRVYVLEQTYDVRVQRTGTAVSVASFPGNTFTVEEVDGDPSGAVNKLVFSNGTVSIVGNTATVTTGGSDVTSVNTQTGDVVLDADDISDAATTNKFATQAQLDKVDHLTVTQAVDLDTIESDTATNNAKVSYTDAAVDARIALANTTDLADTPASLGTAGQVLAVNSGATALEFVDQSAVSTQYHGRYDTEAETERSGATGDVEFYYTARPDGDGTAESETSDVGVTDTINRTLAYSTKFQADPDTAADWTDYTTQPADNATFATAKAALLAGLNETDATAETRGTLPVSLKMTRTTTAVIGDLLLDTYTGAAAAYSVRKLDKDYTGYCMKVRRASDNAEADIGFDSNGDLDTAAIAAHCTTSAGFVSVWYDMSGNSKNATQATAGNQPQIYNGTAVLTDNGKPAVKFSSATLGISGGVQYQTNTATMMTLVMNQAGSRSENIVMSSGSILGSSNLYFTYQDVLTWDNGNRTSNRLQANQPSGWDDTQHLVMCQSTTSLMTLFVDNTSIGTKSSLSSTNDSFIAIGGAGSIAFAGTIQEIVIWPSDESSNRTGIASNTNTYFSIYT